MDTTKSYVTIYNVSPDDAEDFEFEYSVDNNDILTELVPSQGDWGDLSWGIDFEEYEYSPESQTISLVLNTKWAPPLDWLQNASKGSVYFENRLIMMSTIQKDETCVTGIAIMDGEVLQNKTVWAMKSEEVGKYYNDDVSAYELDDLDNQIWDSITKFTNVCEQFYLEKEQQND